MKTPLTFKGLLVPALFILLVQSCTITQVLDDPAEQYIKTQIQEHEPGETGTIKIYPLLAVTATNTTTDLQFTGYKYEGEKNLVVCVRAFKQTGSTKTYDSTSFLVLTVKECQAIVNNYKILEEKVLLEKPEPGEYVYHDYTVNDRLFISFRGTLNPFMKRVAGPTAIDFWIDSRKYSMPTADVIAKIQAFLLY